MEEEKEKFLIHKGYDFEGINKHLDESINPMDDTELIKKHLIEMGIEPTEENIQTYKIVRSIIGF